MADTLNPHAPVYIPTSLHPPLEYDSSPHLTPYYCYDLPPPLQLFFHRTPSVTTILYYSPPPPPPSRPHVCFYVSPHALHSFATKQLSLAAGGAPVPCVRPLLPPCDSSGAQEGALDQQPQVACAAAGTAGVGSEVPGGPKSLARKWKGARGFSERRMERKSRIRREEPQFKEVEGEAVAKTTVMIRNLPNKFTKEQLLEMLEEHCRQENRMLQGGDDAPSEFDFLYLPMDFRSGSNLGYAFVNMTSASAVGRLHRSLQHKVWAAFGSRKVCEVAYARVQGLPALLSHFRNSLFVCRCRDFLPVCYSPPRDGCRQAEHRYVGKHLPVSAGLAETNGCDL